MRTNGESLGCCACTPSDGRRDFLKQAAAMVAGAVASLGGSAMVGEAFGWSWVEPLAASAAS
jgi:hypothetical protein